jgi:hypothetical protein
LLKLINSELSSKDEKTSATMSASNKAIHTTYQYLTNQYIEAGLLDKDGNKINLKGSWDPFIYPDSGYIPPCTVCENGYDTYFQQHTLGKKVTDLLWPHYRCGCLWTRHFEEKIRKLNPDIHFKDR